MSGKHVWSTEDLTWHFIIINFSFAVSQCVQPVQIKPFIAVQVVQCKLNSNKIPSEITF